jgi:acyl-CoA synthetase (AMP-forming)/AMP-acid ligase II
VIIRGGANVYPAEVERVLRTLPGVADAVVVGMPDERLGETVQAVVEQEPGATVHHDALIAGCRAQLAAYKVPVRIVVVEALERNALGKPDQRAAKARLAEGS